MGVSSVSGPLPPFPYPAVDQPPESSRWDRLSPQQLLLGAGAVAVVGTGVAALAMGTVFGVTIVVGLLLSTAALAVLAGYSGTPTSGEALALSAVASAATLVVVGASSWPISTTATWSGFIAVGALALRVISPQLRSWPVTAWVAAQVSVLILLADGGLSGVGLATVLIAVALVGLLLARFASDVLAFSGLLAALPWWVGGVVVIERAAWGGPDGVAAVVLAAAAAGSLLLTASHRVPRLPVSPRTAPMLAGLTAGTAAGGVALGGPPGAVFGAGFLGLGAAAAVAFAAARGPGWVPRDAGLTAAVTLTVLSAAGLVREGRWDDLGVLLIAAAAAAALLSVRSEESRPSAVPITVGALAAAVVLLTSEGPVSGEQVGLVLVAIAVAALGQAALLASGVSAGAVRGMAQRVRARFGSRPSRADRPAPDDIRDAFHPRDTGRPAPPAESALPPEDSSDARAAAPTATTATVVGLLGIAMAASTPARGTTTLLMTVLGVSLLLHGERTGARTTRVLGSVLLVAAAWSLAAQQGWSAPEAVTVPTALVLLAGHARQLRHGPSWAGWGPGLVVGLAPSVALSVLDPTSLRQVLVLAVALVCVVSGLADEVRAPFVLGVLAVVGVTFGWVLADAPDGWLVVLCLVGAIVVALGVARERQQRRGGPVLPRVGSFR